jgi:hypothetical protein
MEAAASSNFPLHSAIDLHEAIRRRAEQIYIESGRVPGRDTENWAQAEREIREEAAQQKHRSAVIVRVDGVRYVGEYCPETADGYVPGEFEAGSPVAVRLQDDRMFVRRANGKELETRIVKRID